MITSSINSKIIRSHNYRFESEHYLNSDSFLSLQLEGNNDKCISLDSIAQVFNPPVFKRQFCKNTPRSVQYFQSSDVQNASETSNIFVFKGQAEALNLFVKKGDVLVTGFGSIGNTRLVSKHQDYVCYANNVCRIRVNDNIKSGFIYAVLSSKYGMAQLNKNASGSVVRYIEAPGVKKTLIPACKESFQQEVDGLIQESALLREEATCYLEDAKRLLENSINLKFKESSGLKTGIVKTSNIVKSLKTRLDPPVFINEGVDAIDVFSENRTITRLRDCNVKIWYPGIFKRAYVNDGLPYIKGSSLFNVNPFKSCNYLSKSRTPMLEQLWLKEEQILMTCAGVCGQVRLITKEYEDKNAIGSPDIIRIQSNDSLYTPQFLFVYFQLPAIVSYMQSMKYGSVIERFDAEHAGSIPIIKPTKELSQKITSIIKQYMDCTYKAFIAEEQAISLVESEIEKWSKE